MKWFVCTVSLIGALLVGADCPAGDEDALAFVDATAAAVSTAMGRLQTGEMDFEYDVTTNGRDREGYASRGKATVKGTVLWQDHLRYSKFDVDLRRTEHLGEDDEITRPHVENGLFEVIQAPDLFAQYNQTNSFCLKQTHDLDRDLRERYFQALDPYVTWFSTSHHGRFTHVFGLTWSPEDAPYETEYEITISRVDSFPRRKLIVQRMGPDIKHGYIIRHGYVVDLDQGGMVVKGWFDPRPGGGKYSVKTWDWDQDEHGVWYAKRWTYSVYDTDDPDDATPDLRRLNEQGVVSRFNSQPKIPKNRFKFSSLKLPRRTRIKYVTAKGTRYTGGTRPEQKKFDLDSLIDDVQEGFAGPKGEGS